MAQRLLFALMIACCSFSANAKWVGLDSKKVDNAFEFQKTPVWCWAEAIVLRTFGQVIPTTGNWIHMTNNLNYKGLSAGNRDILVSASVFYGSPSSEVIVNHLKQKKPIIMAFNNPQTFSGHAVLITGVDYRFVDNRAVIDSLVLRDPYPYNAAHINNKGKVVIPNTITPTHIWLIDATLE